MTSLHNRFESSLVMNSIDPKTLSVPLGEITLKNSRFLNIDMKTGGSCGLGDDVIAFSGDEHGVWFITYNDFFNGNPWVQCVLFNDVRMTLTGVINDDGTYLFVENGHVMKIDRMGEISIMFPSSIIESLLGSDHDNISSTLSRINKYVSSKKPYNYAREDVFAKMISIHRSVDRIASINSTDNISGREMAKIIIEILTLAMMSGVDIEFEVLKQLK